MTKLSASALKHNFHSVAPYSFRDYEIGSYSEAFKKYDEDGKRLVRQAFMHLESGRVWTFLESIHRFLSALDPDEIVLFKQNNPVIFDMVNEYAVVDEVRQF